MGSQFQGGILDIRREARFTSMSTLCFSECQGRGLFDTRMPRFSQLFFYKPDKKEAALSIGQPSRSVALLFAARWYLKSRVRFESKCGISDVLYHYLEEKCAGSEDSVMLSPPSSPASYPIPRLNSAHSIAIRKTFSWPDHPYQATREKA